jgi:hypothetical protein
MKEREYKEALKLLEKIKARKGLSAEDILVCMLIESRLKINLGELKNALALTENVIQAALAAKNFLRALESFTIKAEIGWRSGELDMGLRAVEEGEKLLGGMQLEQAGEKNHKLV